MLSSHKCLCFLTQVLTFTLVSNVSDLRHSIWMTSACPFVFTVFPPQLSVNTFLNHLTFCTVMERQYCLMACLSTWRSVNIRCTLLQPTHWCRKYIFWLFAACCWQWMKEGQLKVILLTCCMTLSGGASGFRAITAAVVWLSRFSINIISGGHLFVTCNCYITYPGIWLGRYPTMWQVWFCLYFHNFLGTVSSTVWMHIKPCVLYFLHRWRPICRLKLWKP